MAKVNQAAVNAELNQTKARLESLNVDAEICGNWIWISGNTKQYSQKLSKLGCHFSKDKEMWFYVPPSLPEEKKDDDDKKKRRSIAEIRKHHGSDRFKKAQASQKRSAAGKSSQTVQASPFSIWEIISKLFMLYTAVYK